jgi:NADPH-dependent ferric siderophore reductase
VTIAGPDLEAMAAAGPAASVRLLLPPAGSTEIVRPAWNGNEFLLPDGRRPPIRTFTPLRADPDAARLALQIVVHGAGVASTWAATAEPGRRAAISGPGRGYTVDRDAPAFLLGGDETAIPAISQLLEAVPRETPVHVCIEVAQPDARVALPEHPRASVEWCDLPPGAPPGDAMVAAVRAADLAPDGRIWVAGEAAAVQRVRRYLFEERGIPRARTSVRGYWKHGRAGETDDA